MNKYEQYRKEYKAEEKRLGLNARMINGLVNNMPRLPRKDNMTAKEDIQHIIDWYKTLTEDEVRDLKGVGKTTVAQMNKITGLHHLETGEDRMSRLTARDIYTIMDALQAYEALMGVGYDFTGLLDFNELDLHDESQATSVRVDRLVKKLYSMVERR